MPGTILIALYGRRAWLSWPDGYVAGPPAITACRCEPTRCFDRHFRPTSDLPRTRFERIAAEIRSGRGMDAVDLYRCGDEYYVLDGHHRIAVARALGDRWILANITNVRMNQPHA